MSETTDNARGRGYRLGVLECAECGLHASLFAAGWRAYGLHVQHTDELPPLAFYCPDCAAPEAGASS